MLTELEKISQISDKVHDLNNSLHILIVLVIVLTVTNIIRTIAECQLQVVDAPKDAQTFNKMLVIFTESIIRRVYLYNISADTIVSEH